MMRSTTWKFDFATVELFSDKIIVNSSVNFKNVNKNYKEHINKLSGNVQGILEYLIEKNKNRVQQIDHNEYLELAAFFSNIASIESVQSEETSSLDAEKPSPAPPAGQSDRASEFKPVAGGGLSVVIEENINLDLDRAGLIQESNAKGSLVITNNSEDQAIWDLEVGLDIQAGASIEDELIKISSLEAGKKYEASYSVDIETSKIDGSPLRITETVNTAPGTEPPSQVFVYDPNSQGQSVSITIAVENVWDWPVRDLVVVKEITEVFSDVQIIMKEKGTVDPEPTKIIWSIDYLEAKDVVRMEFSAVAYPNEIKTYPGGKIDVESVIEGQTRVKFKERGFNASASTAWFLDITERDENPDTWDCWLDFENRSAYPMKLDQITIDLEIDDGKIEPVSLDANVEVAAGGQWTSENFVIQSIQEPRPKGNVLALLADMPGCNLKAGTAALTRYTLHVPSLELVVLALEGTKTFDSYEVESFRESVVNARIDVNVKGMAPLDVINIEDSIPAEFQNPAVDDVEVSIKGVVLSRDQYSITFEPAGGEDDLKSERKMIIVINDVVEHLGPMNDGDAISVSYPLVAPSPPRDTTFATVTILDAYVKDSDAASLQCRIEQEQPIVVVHRRRRTRVAKAIMPGSGKNTYNIVVLYKNKADFAKENITVSDFVPDSFTIIDTKPDCKSETTASGTLLTWVIPEIDAGTEVEISYTIHGEGSAYSLKSIEAKAFK